MTNTIESKRRSELAVRRISHRMGLRFRLHRKDLPDHPDLVFPEHLFPPKRGETLSIGISGQRP